MDILGLFDVPIWLLLLIFLLVTIYVYGTWNYGAFQGSILKGPKPLPIIGTNLPAFTKGVVGFYQDLINKYGQDMGTVAIFDGPRPGVVTINPEVIKSVTIKEFHNFADRTNFTTGTEPTSLMLTILEGEAWKRMRSLMSPTFSSGKLKQMTKSLQECTSQLIEKMKNNAENGIPIAVKECVGAFTLDAIARTSFGLKLNSHENPNDPFVKKAMKAFNITILSPAFLAFFFPFLRPICRLLDIDFVPRDCCDFFGKITEDIIAERAKEHVVQTDFLQLMLNAHKEDQEENDNLDETEREVIGAKPKQGMSHKELIAQSIMFFVAGYDTTATTLTYFLYNLTVYPEVQEKLRSEVIKRTGGKEIVNYSSIVEMTFMDNCIKETQRLYPSLLRFDRIAKNDINIQGIDIKKGWSVIVPVYALHRNPAVWPEPEEFKPERFEDLNSDQAASFMPFGNGPRACIGMRLALLEIKIATAYILKNFKLVKCAETQFPLKLDKMRTFIAPEKPIKIGLEPRA